MWRHTLAPYSENNLHSNQAQSAKTLGVSENPIMSRVSYSAWSIVDYIERALRELACTSREIPRFLALEPASFCSFSLSGGVINGYVLSTCREQKQAPHDVSHDHVSRVNLLTTSA